MIVVAELDLSESGAVDLPDARTPVLIYPSGDTPAPDDWSLRYDHALATMAKCRLLREGHVFSIETFTGTALSVWVKPGVRYTLDDTGEVVWR